MTKLQLSPTELIRTFWQDRWVVVAIVGLSGVLSVAFALTRKPMFTSEALLAPAEADRSALGGLSGVLGQMSALTGVLGIGGMGTTDVEEVTAVMQSREFSLRFIAKHDLLPDLFPEREWEQRKPAPATAPADGAQPANAQPQQQMREDVGNDEKLRVEDILDRFALVRKVTIDRRTGFVSLSVRARDAKTAQRIAQAMIDDVNGELRARTLAEARRAEDFLNAKIASAQYESIRNTAAALLESQLKREVVAETRPDFALRMLDPPSLPETRSYPRRTRMVLVGGFIGSFVAFVVVLVRRRRITVSEAR